MRNDNAFQVPGFLPARRRAGWLALSMLAVLAGCAGAPGQIRYATGRDARVSEDGLHTIQTWAGMARRVYVKPGADLSTYDRVMLDPVVVRFSLISGRTLDRDKVALVEKTFQDIFEKELKKSTVYTLVSEPGPRVLRLTPQLVNVVVTAPPRPLTPDEQFVIQSAGAVTLELELSDSLSRAALVRAFDRREVGGQTGLAYRDTGGANLAQAQLVFIQWAQRLRSWLDSVREIPPLPAEG